VVGGLLFFGGAAFAYQAFGHVRNRVNIWLEPMDYYDQIPGSGQIVEGLFGMAWGGPPPPRRRGRAPPRAGGGRRRPRGRPRGRGAGPRARPPVAAGARRAHVRAGRRRAGP
jgi:hypothetical protein